jgi:hypothetical protein
MLKTVSKSSNKKLGGCAATYRSGSEDVFGTCPNSCNLKPAGRHGSERMDAVYLQAVLRAVPDGGLAWTYTHFVGPDDLAMLPPVEKGQTVINISADTMGEAANFYLDGFPTVVAVPKVFDAKVDVVETEFGPVKFVRCPAEYREEANCGNCGGKNAPLCARGDRSYVIKFTAHGNQAKKVGSEQSGGCYGSGGPVAIQWANTKKALQEQSDAEKLTEWIKTLPFGTWVRHHVVGDLGAD